MMKTPMTELEKLQQWNAFSVEQAARAILPCCGSHVWANSLSRQRPFQDLELLLAASDGIWWSLPEEDWNEAFGSHPRIGESNPTGMAAEASLKWSRGEQGASQSDDVLIKAELTAYNEIYEKQFGRIFIVCATGKSSGEMLSILKERLKNNPEAELREAAEQQKMITRLRLKKWLREES